MRGVEMINIAKPNLGEEEKKAVCNVIDSGMIACGAIVEKFENEFSNFCNCKYGVATTSGTTALEVALRAVGIGVGDKVLTTAYSFIATTNAIVYTGATPVFADIDKDSFNISPEEIEKKLEADSEIKALLIVHLFGQPCDMDRIVSIANKYNVMLLEDCAQAHGAECNGKKVGSLGIAAAFSFYPTKNMTTGEGGMIVTNDEKVCDNAKMIINHGMKVRYHHDVIGYNYRMTNIAAAIGLCQLSKLEGFNEKRKRNAAFYFNNINNSMLVLPQNREGHVYHQFTIRVLNNKRKEFITYLEKNEIGYGIFYPLSIPEQRCYDKFGFDTKYNVTDEIKEEVVSIPVHPLLSDSEVETICNVINAFGEGE